MESGIRVCGIRVPQCGIRNPRLSWITLHGAKFPFSDINSNLILSQESSKRLIIGFDFSYFDLRESNDHCPRMTVD